MKRAAIRSLVVLAVVALGSLAVSTAPQTPGHPGRGEGFGLGGKKPRIPWTGKRRTAPLAKNMRLVGWSDMGGRPDGEQIVGGVMGGRDYVVVGHMWSQGATVLDVTDPGKPDVVAFIPSMVPWGAIVKLQLTGTTMMVPLRSLNAFPGGQRPLPRYGVLFYDMSNPRQPREISYFRTADADPEIGDGVHFAWYEGRYAYLSAPVSGYRGLIFMIVDVTDPQHPKEAGRWWHPGQHIAGGEKFVPGETPTLHGAQANRDHTLGFAATLQDPPGGLVILDIRDKAHPTPLSRIDMSPPMLDSYFGVHNVVTMDSRKILVAMNEGTGNPRSKAQQTGWVIDYSNPSKPVILSILPIPTDHDMNEPVRFGPHNAHENHSNGLIDDYMLYISWFRSGVRAFDLSDPKHPVETGFFRPADPEFRIDPRQWSGTPGDPDGSELSSMMHVYVDKRGYLYATGYNDGLYILEYTGPRPEGSRTALAQARRDHADLVASSRAN